MTQDASDPSLGRKPESTSLLPPGFDWSYLNHTADRRVLPDFIIIGAARAGTTSLFNWLTSHPDVTPPVKKETHFFDRHHAKGLRWYRSNFPLAGFGGITGEATPYLLFHPLAAARVARDLPSNTRIIAVLREPVQRALSHYWWARSKGWEIESFDRAIVLEPERLAGSIQMVMRGEWSEDHRVYSYLARGRYADQLRTWIEAVGRERLLILESEGLQADPSDRGRVLDWLRLPQCEQPYPVANRAERIEETSPELLERLREYFLTYNDDLFELLGHELWVK